VNTTSGLQAPARPGPVPAGDRLLAGGQGDLEGKMFRISHMGYVDPVDTIGLLAAVEFTLAESGVKVEIGKGVATAARVLREWA